jgi:hypothetical protein
MPCVCVVDVRWGAQLTDVRWGVQLADVRWGAQLADMPCVAFGRPFFDPALHCIGAPNLGEEVLRSLPPSQNLFLSILQLVF